MQRSQYDASPAQSVCVMRHDQRVRIQLNHRVDPRTVLVQSHDAGEIFLGQFLRSKPARGHLRLELCHCSFVVLRGNGVRRRVLRCPQSRQQQRCKKEIAYHWSGHLSLLRASAA